MVSLCNTIITEKNVENFTEAKTLFLIITFAKLYTWTLHKNKNI